MATRKNTAKTARKAEEVKNETAEEKAEETKTTAEETEKAETAPETVEKTEFTEEQKAEATEEKEEPSFVADPKDRRPRGCTARLQIEARYTDEQAQNMLRKKIYQYKEVHARFLRKVEEQSAFFIEKQYVPVYCGKTDVRYSWKTKANKVETPHEEITVKERRFSGAHKDLDVCNFLMDDLPEVMEKKRSELFEPDAYTFKKSVQEFNEYIRSVAPAKRVNIEKRGEEYTLVYVPVMKATCTFDGEKYIGYVNLHNGACYSSYKVSDAVEKAAEKTVTAAKLAKRTLLSTFAFALALSLMTLFSALKLADWKFGSLTAGTIWSVCILAALSLPSIVFACGINTVKKTAQIEKAVATNKLPNAAWPRFASVLGVVCTLSAVLVFFFRVMI